MELATARRLSDLNRRFYDEHAEHFADSRPRLAPGVKRILGQIPAGARVLEVGCGDGKVARWLAQRANIAAYLGLDSSVAMLERAGRVTHDGWQGAGDITRHSSLVTFALADLASPGWTNALPAEPFDWILSFATFHHLPGRETRTRVLQTLAQHLAPGGTLVMSNWQFTRSPRLRRLIVPWATLNLSEAEVEPDDYLLTWERAGKRGLRYVHLLDETEARELAVHAGLQVVDVFESDGGAGALAEYVQMQKSE